MTNSPLTPERIEYRKDLIALEQRAQEAYDTTLLTLSGGALGVSFAFVKDFLGTQAAVRPRWLIARGSAGCPASPLSCSPTISVPSRSAALVNAPTVGIPRPRVWTGLS